MTQAQIALETRKGPSGLWLRFMAALRARREQRKALVKFLSQLDTGIASGARV
jgi:hypothetical protein